MSGAEASLERKPVLSPLWALVLFLGLAVVYSQALHVVENRLSIRLALNSLRSKTIVAAAASTALDWGWLAMVILLLRLRGQSLRDIGWVGWGTIRAWVVAAVAAAFLGWSALFGPAHFLEPRAWISDWSAFRIGLMLDIAFTAGICEETIFRGFVMTQARDAGTSPIVQILLSALLFGLGHIGWGRLGGAPFNLAAAFGAFWSTAIFGAVFAIVYLIARRKLLPGIVGHGLVAGLMEPWMMTMAIAGTLHIGH